ncbi:MAG: T9SS type A sorting domain-containing protein [Saprospiraceae bacterium]
MNKFIAIPIQILALHFIGLLGLPIHGIANVISGNPGNYLQKIGVLQPGDTLLLEPGTYANNMKLVNINGKPGQPIVLMGSGQSTVLIGNSCCNTVSLTKCSFLVLSHLSLDGQNQFVDAVKAEGTTGNWTHDITIQYCTITGYGIDQQAVGISTKCPSWNWIIRKNKIIGAGTGLYLGNSDGYMPFVNGIIEYNYIASTVGYNMQIKHQINGSRDVLPETMIDAHTTIRYNVFTKDSSSSSGGNARPNLLTGGFPTTGWGSKDYYEIYGNFFYNNPVEALYQGTGNIIMYDNIFVNHFDPAGIRAVYFTPQNGVNPQTIHFFHNTLWAANSSGGVRLYNPAPGFVQDCYANAVFAPYPISNFSNEMDNVKDTYNNASSYVLAARNTILNLDLFPKAGQLTGALTPDTLTLKYKDAKKDFNGDSYAWTYRGAYSGCCQNKGWKLQLDTIPDRTVLINSVPDLTDASTIFSIWPNPSNGELSIQSPVSADYLLTELSGREILSGNLNAGVNEIRISSPKPGMVILVIYSGTKSYSKKIFLTKH